MDPTLKIRNITILLYCKAYKKNCQGVKSLKQKVTKKTNEASRIINEIYT